MTNGQTSDMPVMHDAARDTRLLTALYLLEKPVRRPTSPYLPLLASSGLAGSALLLAYTMIIGPGLKDNPPSEKPVASFEISGNPDSRGSNQIKAQSITPPVQEAVLVGTEASR